MVPSAGSIANDRPILDHVVRILDALEADMGLAIGTRYAEATARLSEEPTRPIKYQND